MFKPICCLYFAKKKLHSLHRQDSGFNFLIAFLSVSMVSDSFIRVDVNSHIFGLRCLKSPNHD